MGFADDHKRAWAAAKAAPARQPVGKVGQGKPTAATSSVTDRQYLAALEIDLARLRRIESHAKRDVIKRDELLPRYRDYLAAYMASQKTEQNDVLVQNIIWALDCGAEHFDWAIQLADYAIRHGMASPENFQRNILNILLGQLADWCIQQLRLSKSPEPYATRMYEYAKDKDVIDQIAAQLIRCQAEKLKNADPEAALAHAETAYRLDNKVGVLPLINQLRRAQTAHEQQPEPEQPV